LGDTLPEHLPKCWLFNPHSDD